MKQWYALYVSLYSYDEIKKKLTLSKANELTHWGQATHICVTKLNVIGSDNGSSPGWCQAIIWTNVGIMLIGTLGTNLSENLSEMAAILSQPQCVK